MSAFLFPTFLDIFFFNVYIIISCSGSECFSPKTVYGHGLGIFLKGQILPLTLLQGQTLFAYWKGMYRHLCLRINTISIEYHDTLQPTSQLVAHIIVGELKIFETNPKSEKNCKLLSHIFVEFMTFIAIFRNGTAIFWCFFGELYVLLVSLFSWRCTKIHPFFGIPASERFSTSGILKQKICY